MARPATNHAEKRALIVAAATSVFARHGYTTTTNNLIAAEIRARGSSCTPALIYHYFPEGKKQLFQAVLAQFQVLQNLGQLIEETQDAPPEEFFTKVAHAYLQIFQDETVWQLLPLVFREAANQPEIVESAVSQIGPTLFLPLLRYFTHQVEVGRLLPLPTGSLVFQFFGPLIARSLIGHALGSHAAALPFSFPDQDGLVSNLVKTFLYGLTPPASLKGDNTNANV